MASFGQRFYNTFKRKGLEKKLTVLRDNKIVSDDLLGIISSDSVLMLPPGQEMILKTDDIVSDGNNKYAVLSIHDSGGESSVWEITIKLWNDFKRQQNYSKPSITNNVSSNNFAQNIGNNGSIDFSNNSYQVKDLSNELLNVAESDRELLLEVISEFEKLQTPDKTAKRGFLKKFDNLLEKYPNISKIVADLMFGWATGHLN